MFVERVVAGLWALRVGTLLGPEGTHGSVVVSPGRPGGQTSKLWLVSVVADRVGLRVVV